MSELRYPLEQPLSAEQQSFIANSLASSFAIASVNCGDDLLTITHASREEADAIRRMTKRFVFISKNMNRDLIYSNEVEPRYQLDPQPQLERVRDVVPIAPGFFTLQGEFLAVFKALNALVKQYADTLGAIEQEYPAVWPVKLFKSIDYFHEFPHQVILCAPVKEDFASRQAFSERYASDQPYESVPMNELMADSEYGLEPAVCDCCYFGISGSRDISNQFYTCYNKVFRNERSQSNRLDRLTNFSVRDIMFVGEQEFVLESRQRLIELLSGLLDSLCLRSKIETANDPFFANDSAMKSAFQNAHRLKYELLADIPHLGTSIAVGSINLHLNFFGKAFDIQTTDSEAAHSGCIGVGMERMAYALFCQHGPSLSEWPDHVLGTLELTA